MTAYASATTTTRPQIADFELDTILTLTDAIRQQALIYADDQEDQVGEHLQASFDDVKLIFFEFNEPDMRTHVVFQTVHNLLFAA